MTLQTDDQRGKYDTEKRGKKENNSIERDKR